MSKEEFNGQEETLNFEEAKDMTVGEAARKSEELEAGVTSQDSVLDKYIKQHREEIEAGKFDTQVLRAQEEGQALVSEPVEEAPHVETVPITPQANPTFFQEEPVAAEVAASVPFYKKKAVVYTAAAVLGVFLLGGTVYTVMQNNRAGTPTASSTSKSSSKASSSSSSTDAAKDLKEFNDLYDSFYTDADKKALQNDKFGELDKLKTALDKLKGTSEYEAAKAKYDDLAKQVSAIQKVNSQFETAAITNGVLDPNAKAKSDAAFSDVTTGNKEIDSVLKSAVDQGRGQLVATPAPQTGNAVVADPTPATPVTPVAPVAPVTPVTPAPAAGSIVVSGYGVSTATFLQRHLSRVPYNQAAINDVNNPAWNFPAGVLENILNESRRRGYFTGDNYVLERVNIINGNGYYNLFKSDGTYLFSINARTGYYVGNAKGHAENVDF